MKWDLKELLLSAHRAIADAGARHALMGAFGMTVHGYQRATNDIDFLVDGDLKDTVKKKLSDQGFSVFHETAEVLQLDGKGPIDIVFANRSLSKAMLNRNDLPEIFGVPCLLAEDIIGLKIQALSNNKKRRLKELGDIQMLAEAKRELDWAKVKTYADLFGEWPALNEIKEGLESDD